MLIDLVKFSKVNRRIDQGEGTGTIVSTEPDNEIKYRKESARKSFYQ